MARQTFEEEIRRLPDGWNRSLLEKDAAAAARLRADGYTAALPYGVVLTKEEELALIASTGHTVESVSARDVEVRGGGDEATARFDSLIEGEFRGERIDALYRYTLPLRKTGGAWRALSSRPAGVVRSRVRWGRGRRAPARPRPGARRRRVAAIAGRAQPRAPRTSRA